MLQVRGRISNLSIMRGASNPLGGSLHGARCHLVSTGLPVSSTSSVDTSVGRICVTVSLHITIPACPARCSPVFVFRRARRGLPPVTQPDLSAAGRRGGQWAPHSTLGRPGGTSHHTAHWPLQSRPDRLHCILTEGQSWLHYPDKKEKKYLLMRLCCVVLVVPVVLVATPCCVSVRWAGRGGPHCRTGQQVL